MVYYRRSYVKGGHYFFTVTLQNRQSHLLINEIESLRWAMQKVKNENPYLTKAIVILPDHIHAIWELPANDNDYSGRWRKIKGYFSNAIANQGHHRFKKNKHGEYRIWQTRFWEHTLRNDLDIENHINYIHYNPVKHGLVKNVSDWKFSSFHHYVQLQILPKGWAENIEQTKLTVGEQKDPGLRLENRLIRATKTYQGYKNLRKIR